MAKKKRRQEEFEDSFSDEGVVELPVPDPIIVYQKPKDKAIPKTRNKKPIELKRQKN